MFKDLHGLWSPNYYYTRVPTEVANQYSLNGLTGTGLNTLKINASRFAYLFTAATTIGNYNGNWFTGNTVVHSLTGFKDNVSQNWVCSNFFSEVQSGVLLDNSFFTRVNDNEFGGELQGGITFFDDDAKFVGTGVRHVSSNQLFMRNNTIHDYKEGLFALHGSQRLTTSKGRLYNATPMTWAWRYEVEGRNVFDIDITSVNSNKYLTPVGGQLRRNDSYDANIDATAGLVLACGYNSMALRSEFHLHRNEENPQGEKAILVDFNEWNFLDGTNQGYDVRPQPNLFLPIGDDLDDLDAVADNCGPIVDNQDAQCPVVLFFDDQGPTIRFNDGGFNDKHRPASIVQNDRDTAIQTMLNPAFCSARRYEAVGDALQLTILLDDSVAYRIFEAACDTLAEDSMIECYVRTKAAVCKVLSLNTSGMFSASFSAVQLLKNSPMCISDTTTISRIHQIISSGVLDHVDSATYASLASMSRITIQEDVARHEPDTLFQKPGIPGNDNIVGFRRVLAGNSFKR